MDSLKASAGLLYSCAWLVASVAFGAEGAAPPESIPPSFFWVTGAHQVPVDVHDFLALFEVGEFSLNASGQREQRLPYRLFKPVNQNAGTKYPLIVWLHGYGEEEITLGNAGQLKHTQMIFRDPAHPERYPFFLLAPQNVESTRWFSDPNHRNDSSGQKLSSGELVAALVKDLVAKYPIDSDRITLVGISSGATASWEFGIRYPGLFAAIAPLGSAGCDKADIEALVPLPIWAFHGEYDYADGDRMTVSRIQSQGGNATLTETPGAEHNSWYWAFNDHGLLSWLMAQRKGSSGTRRIVEALGRLAWWAWAVAAMALCVLGWIAVRRFWRVRRSKSA